MFFDYLIGLMAPWRRINRIEFLAALTVLSLPGFIMLLMGIMDSVGGWAGHAQTMAQSVQGGGLDGLLNTARGGGVPAEPTVSAVMTLPALINGLFLLLMYPFVRGRLLDRGINLRAATLLAVVVQLSVLNDILAALVGAPRGPLPFGVAFGMLTFVAYLALSFGASRARKTHEKGPSRHSQLNDDFPPPRF
jgi:hypothetical protein